VRSSRHALASLALVVGLFAGCDQLPQAAQDLAVGECFDVPSETTDITEIQRRPCNAAHDAEVFAVLNHPAPADEPYPVISGVGDLVEDECVPLFAEYTGVGIDDQQELDIGWFYPTMQGWRDGDREVTCYLVALEGKLDTSRRAGSP
jgi:hypothetical protein